MTDDIVKRLRAWQGGKWPKNDSIDDCMAEAADEIERLRATSAPEVEPTNNDLTRKIDKMHDAILDTEASGRPAGNLFQVWWLLKTEVERLTPQSLHASKEKP